MSLYEKAPAKINLCLNVLRKREDGFHEMEMLMTPIDLADRLTFSLLDREISLDSNSSFMPLDERNIVYKTAQLLKDTYQVTQGADIYIEKNIPIAAGLGGGSSDAAATLRGLNRLWNLELSLDELARLGEQIGSDVPFCVYNQTAFVSGRGEIVEPIQPFPKAWVILVKPPKGISSWTVFKDLDISQLLSYEIQAMREAIENHSFKDAVRYAGNALEVQAVKQNPLIIEVKDKMLQFGAETALMSGTGPTVYGLTQNMKKAQRIVNGLKGFCKEVYLVRTL
ncbi:4-diphosphocytidyl-2-C-methyl-D-erythritol kinase [Alkalibacterium putridalgicola]|uniref:4-diphosphocytidyl-2-C-methyl-D-erythritol kinase n=1 Tax=Alkalibacterium putridalgicola TaxID=426703 RepID=A0A1H7U0W0_9LACT|nr:4-(cytidine 5'-diphospho)-2-C-methyl-D-erythritol kinase [Alkalibacterium putridalgicola]GEK89519.1 4-diphosphocytidyl-2-C-methyl-D-erythritol kinase [Alkalibacterium putridalgicola]SEL90425.1 4-diphosphocytidyl-2-C-methyl-D-erythritol kinase [Alkalibacterium putridalgicola]